MQWGKELLITVHFSVKSLAAPEFSDQSKMTYMTNRDEMDNG